MFNKGIGALISGFGDYKVNSNSLMSGGLDPPTIVNSVNNGGVIVRHREYLRDISAASTFTITSLNINPGLYTSFPWLSNVAQHFEQYRVRGIIYEFKSLSSDAVLSAATSSALGSIIMATQYDALDPAFPNKFAMENYEFANSSKPSISFIHPVECAKKQTTVTELYVRPDDVPEGADIRLYDLGVFNIAAVGMQAATGIAGELWCTYEIEFFKPRVPNLADQGPIADHFTGTTGGTNAAPFTGNAADADNMIGGTLDTNRYTFPSYITSGSYLVMFVIYGASTACTAATLTLSGCSGLNMWKGSTQGTIGSVGTVTQYIQFTTITVTGAGAYVNQGTNGTFPASPTNMDFVVMQIPPDLVSLLSIHDKPLTLSACQREEEHELPKLSDKEMLLELMNEIKKLKYDFNKISL